MRRNHTTPRVITCMFNTVFSQQPGGWREALLINQQFAVYPHSSAISYNPAASSAKIVPPTATKIHTLTHSYENTLISSVINH